MRLFIKKWLKNCFLSSVIFSLIFCFMMVSKAFALPSPVISLWEEVEDYDIDAPLIFANPDAPKGGSATTTMVGSYDNFNFFSPRGKTSYQIILTYEALAEAVPNASGVLRGVLADSFDLSKDRSSLRVTINPLAHFSDNTKVTAHDVVFTFNALIKEASPTYRLAYQDVIEVKAESDSTVLFRFAPNSSRELPLEVCQLPVLAKHWWKGKNMGDPHKEPFIGSGAYKVKSYTFGAQLVLERDKNHWAKDLPRNQGRANLDELLIDFYRDATVARESFLAGNADYYSERSMKDWSNGYNIQQVKDGKIQLKAFVPDRTIGIMGLVLNTRKPLLADKNIRHALMLLMDFEWLNKTIYYNSYHRIDSYFTGHNLDLQKTPTKAELAVLNEYKDQLSPAVFGELPQIPVTDGSGNMRAQMTEAVKLFKNSGWELKNGKMLDKNGKQFKLTLIANTPTVQKTYAQYAQVLSRIGIDLKIQLLDQNQYTAEVKNYDFDLCYVFIPQGPNPGNEQRYLWGSEAAKAFGSRNFAGIQDPVIDAVIEKLISAKSEKELKNYTRVLDRLLQHGIYFIPGWYSPEMRIAWWKNRVMPGTLDYIEFTSMLNCWYSVK